MAKNTTTAADVNAYLAALPRDIRTTLERLRVVIRAHRDELAAFDTSGGTIHFAADRPLPDEVVVRLVQARVAQADAVNGR